MHISDRMAGMKKATQCPTLMLSEEKKKKQQHVRWTYLGICFYSNQFLEYCLIRVDNLTVDVGVFRSLFRRTDVKHTTFLRSSKFAFLVWIQSILINQAKNHIIHFTFVAWNNQYLFLQKSALLKIFWPLFRSLRTFTSTMDVSLPSWKSR